MTRTEKIRDSERRLHAQEDILAKTVDAMERQREYLRIMREDHGKLLNAPVTIELSREDAEAIVGPCIMTATGSWKRLGDALMEALK